MDTRLECFRRVSVPTVDLSPQQVRTTATSFCGTLTKLERSGDLRDTMRAVGGSISRPTANSWLRLRTIGQSAFGMLKLVGQRRLSMGSVRILIRFVLLSAARRWLWPAQQ